MPKKTAEPRPPPTLLLLCGLPGAGKSTFATALEARAHKGRWIRVSPDDVGSMVECKKMIEKGLKHGNNVVLDRCNGFLKERKMFIREVADYKPNVECVFMATPAAECIDRVQNRKGHPTLPPENAEKAVSEFAGAFQPPERLSEGPYHAIHVVGQPDEIKELMARYLAMAM